MALVACPECKAEISSSAAKCPQCGFKKPMNLSWLWAVLVFGGLFIGFGVIQNNTPEGQEKGRQREVIERCLKIASQNPGNPIASGACKLMEDSFKAQFGVSP